MTGPEVVVPGASGPEDAAPQVSRPAQAAPRPPVDALLLVSFGGPEGPDDVLPFLRTVTRGRRVPADRLAAVSEHYQRFGGRSPINDQNRALLAALRAELAPLPVYWGNRNWRPYLVDAVERMRADGVRRAACFVTSAFSSYSGCRQYRENLADALAGIGPRSPGAGQTHQDPPAGGGREDATAAPHRDGGPGGGPHVGTDVGPHVGTDVGRAGAGADLPDGPDLLKLRVYFDHPGFVEPMVDRVDAALAALPAPLRAEARLVFVAHSVPMTQARESGPDGGAYPAQLHAASQAIAELVAERRGGANPWQVAYCSRSGPPAMPWLEPDVNGTLEALAAGGERAVVLVPVGFVSDHMEVVHDLDVEALGTARRLGLVAVRAATVGTDPRFVRMVAELLAERADPGAPRPALSPAGPFPDVCPSDCCTGLPRADRRPAAAGTPADGGTPVAVEILDEDVPGVRMRRTDWK
jgi:ferrochelatase